MNVPLRIDQLARVASPFDLDDDGTYRRWRDWKLGRVPGSIDQLVVNLRDPQELARGERDALLDCISRAGFAIYRSPVLDDDAGLPLRLGARLGLLRLDANWLAGENGVSRIAVSGGGDGHGGFIPYTDRAIGWHTDGYYHPPERRIRGMVLHCVRPAAEGGENALLDPELAYIELRDRSPALVRALMQPDAMVIPERTDESGIARAAQRGPVFSIDPEGCLHMRYTARTRSIEWRNDPLTLEAAAQLGEMMRESPHVWRVRMSAGMGMVGHNVLHDRQAFRDDPLHPRLVLRARFLDRVAPPTEASWRNG